MVWHDMAYNEHETLPFAHDETALGKSSDLLEHGYINKSGILS